MLRQAALLLPLLLGRSQRQLLQLAAALRRQRPPPSQQTAAARPSAALPAGLLPARLACPSRCGCCCSLVAPGPAAHPVSCCCENSESNRVRESVKVCARGCVCSACRGETTSSSSCRPQLCCCSTANRRPPCKTWCASGESALTAACVLVKVCVCVCACFVEREGLPKVLANCLLDKGCGLG